MTHGPEHHIEHAEHDKHAAHDPFDRNVSLTIAIIAAVLAGVTLASHRSHNDVLRFQAEANRYQTLSNIKHTKATDAWSYYQAKNIRYHEYRSFIGMMDALAKDEKMSSQREALVNEWKKQVKKYKIELPKQQEDAEKLGKDGEALQEQSKEMLQESEKAHHQSNFFDAAELLAEIAVVLCSLAVLTKRRGFWYSSMVLAALSLGITGLGFMPHDHGHEAETSHQGTGHDEHKAAPEKSSGH